MADGFTKLLASARKHFTETLTICRSMSAAKSTMYINKKRLLDKVDCSSALQARVALFTNALKGTHLEDRANTLYQLAVCSNNMAVRSAEVICNKHKQIENKIKEGFINEQESGPLIQEFSSFQKECTNYCELCSEANIMTVMIYNDLVKAYKKV